MKRAMRYFLKVGLLGFMLGLVIQGSTQAWWNNDWTIRKKITIDTGVQGSAISDPIGTSAVLIRLHDGDFQFASARDDGSDLRFIAADDKTPLAYHIEKYDSLLGEAFVWISVPDLKPGAQTAFWLYYGASGGKPAPGGAQAKGTYDADTALVYHFSEKSGDPAQDSSGQANNAQNGGLVTESSLIGSGLRLDGKTPVTIPPSSSLGWTDGGVLTWSAWIKPAALAPNAAIFSRRNGTNSFLIGVDSGVPFVELNGARSGTGAPIAVGAWHHLAVTVDGGNATLYLDGISYATLNASLPALDSAAVIGGDGSAGFVGEIDELEISKVARPAGFLKFAAQEQSGDATSKLLAVGQDEQPPAGWLSNAFGLFGVILKSVTIDGWVVIGFLAVMSLVSWYVMITKFFYLKEAAQGNREFLKEWHHVAADLTVLDQGDADQVKTLGGRVGPKQQRRLRHASLYRIYHIGAEEIRHRLAHPDSTSRVLSPQSIQAIRASLDSGYVRETRALQSGLVFLTISIAGGPFLGLLGTVVGVMITFGAIAETGEVNISAIAPGLAAALVATVAGLVVAIPALLGYNYLVSLLKDVTSDLQIFIDEFVTKLAEFYRPVAGNGAAEEAPTSADQFVQQLIDTYLLRAVQTQNHRPASVPQP
jgi:biopolymer transport protein ExbB